MNWRDHSRLTGKHALLGASNYHWLNYDADRLTNAVLNYQAKERGTRLHAFAAECIDLKQKLPKNKKTLNTYVNDAIGFRMDTEQVLYYSDNCYGTADAISFNDGFLRIHDLKTGAVPAHMEQLYIYAALFCLEYGYSTRARCPSTTSSSSNWSAPLSPLWWPLSTGGRTTPSPRRPSRQTNCLHG